MESGVLTNHATNLPYSQSQLRFPSPDPNYTIGSYDATYVEITMLCYVSHTITKLKWNVLLRLSHVNSPRDILKYGLVLLTSETFAQTAG